MVRRNCFPFKQFSMSQCVYIDLLKNNGTIYLIIRNFFTSILVKLSLYFHQSVKSIIVTMLFLLQNEKSFNNFFRWERIYIFNLYVWWSLRTLELMFMEINLILKLFMQKLMILSWIIVIPFLLITYQNVS